MSKFIPMVSASPPPLDENEFEWEEEDDDFSKLTDGDDSLVDMNWSNKTYNKDRNGRNSMDCDNDTGQQVIEEKLMKETKTHIVSKPEVKKLPLLTDNHITDNKHSSKGEGETSFENNDSSEEERVQPGSLKRDSDSGMFSTDISPIPVSEDGTVELEADCDNSVDEEIDEMTNLPSDSNISSEICEEEQTLNTFETPPPEKSLSDSKSAAKFSNVLENNPIPKHTDILHNSDEEFDQLTSNTLDSLSNRSTESVIESGCTSEEIHVGDFASEHDLHKSNVKNVSSPKNDSLNGCDVEEDDEFGDFADFSSQNENWEDAGNRCALSACSGSSSTNELLESKYTIISKSQSESSDHLKTYDFKQNLEVKDVEVDKVISDNGDGKISDFQGSQDGNISHNTTDKVNREIDLEENSKFVDSEQLAQKIAFNEEKDGVLSCPSVKNEKDLSCETEKKNLLDNRLPLDDMNDCSVKNETEDPSVKVIDNDEDEFADFSCATSAGQTGDNEDFADFISVAFNSHNDNTLSKTMDGDDDDDFADFTSVTLPSKSSEVSSQCITSNVNYSDDENDVDEDDFSDFRSVKPACKESDDWAAFGEAHSVTQSKAIDAEKLQTVIEASFMLDLNSTHATKNVSLLDTILLGSIYHQNEECFGRGHSVRKVMKQVFDYDNTNALIYQWKKSQSNDRLFKTLNIDTKNMFFGLKKEVVPLSLTSLTLLEPIRGAIPGKKEKSTEALVEPNNMDSLPQLEDMPPVEFDWDNSGLTNPLEAKTLDLDFMVVQENENSIKTGVFQSEILDAPRSSVKPMQPLEDILKTMKLTTTTAHSNNKKDDNLSKEAESIIESLPLLSFMKSKVLMFRLQNS